MSFDKPNFVACFDISYTVQALALIQSLENKVIDYNFFIFCMDDKSFKIISNLNNKKIIALKFSNFEDSNLKKLKKDRKKNEYFWTITPKLPLIIFENFKDIDQVTYLDTDIFFLKSPKYIYRNFNKTNKDLLITKHNYSPEYDKSEISGKFCVQFLIINRRGYDIIKNWESLCNEWCYDKIEKNRYGDQKYLDDWPEKYKDRVYIEDNKNAFQGPWNANSTNPSEAIVYHFHGLRKIVKNFYLLNRGYNIPSETKIKIYDLYFNILKKIIFKYNGNLDILTLSNRGKISLVFEILLSQFKTKKNYITKNLSE